MPSLRAKNVGELPQKVAPGKTGGPCEAHQPMPARPAPAQASHAYVARGAPPACARVSSPPDRRPANRKPANGSSVKFVRPGVGCRYHRSGSGIHASAGDVQTTGATTAAINVTTPNNQARLVADAVACHNQAPATIESPITFRMSTVSSVIGAPWPSTSACTRKRNARAKICHPRRQSRRPAAATPAFLACASAASAIDTPATKRKSGAPRPAMKLIVQKAGPCRSVSNVHESETCPSTMVSTARPRTQSRCGNRPDVTGVVRQRPRSWW
jgi:hypothetical protein